MLTVTLPVNDLRRYTDLFWEEGCRVELNGVDYHIHSISTSLKHPDEFKMELDEWPPTTTK